MAQDKTPDPTAAWPLSFGGDPMGGIRKLSEASAEAMTAWTDAWGAMLANRGAPIGEAFAKTFASPTAWPNALAPMLDEIRAALNLPTFADMPGRDLFSLPSPAPLLGLLQVSQDYAAVSVPVWVKACERYLAEVKQSQDASDGKELDAGALLDIWNNVLDRTLMEFNRSDDFAKAQQTLLRAAAKHRQELSSSVERMAKLVDMPTRSEMTDVYRRLHDLNREVHALRKEVRELRRQTKETNDDPVIARSEATKQSTAGQ